MSFLSRRGVLAAAIVSLVFAPAVVAQEGREIDFHVEVTINGQGVPVIYVSGGMPLDEGRRAENGSVMHSEASPLTLGADAEGMKEILELIEETLSARRGPLIEVTRETRAGKVSQTFIGADPGSVEADESTGEITIKPIRLELNA